MTLRDIIVELADTFDELGPGSYVVTYMGAEMRVWTWKGHDALGFRLPDGVVEIIIAGGISVHFRGEEMVVHWSADGPYDIEPEVLFGNAVMDRWLHRDDPPSVGEPPWTDGEEVRCDSA